MKIKLFLDGAEIERMKSMCAEGLVKGFTTNPTLMHKAGITNYEQFAKQAIAVVNGLPISFEVFSDDFETMEKEARKIASWGGTTYVKIPITNTKGETAIPLIQRLSRAGLALNVTAMMTVAQVRAVAEAVDPASRTIVSVFAGRIADTGRDPIPLMTECARILAPNRNAELLWASPRELLNVFHAEESGCHIITATHDIVKKLALVGKDLDKYSLETVQMFYNDAKAAGFRIV